MSLQSSSRLCRLAGARSPGSATADDRRAPCAGNGRPGGADRYWWPMGPLGDRCPAAPHPWGRSHPDMQPFGPSPLNRTRGGNRSARDRRPAIEKKRRPTDREKDRHRADSSRSHRRIRGTGMGEQAAQRASEFRQHRERSQRRHLPRHQQQQPGPILGDRSPSTSPAAVAGRRSRATSATPRSTLTTAVQQPRSLRRRSRRSRTALTPSGATDPATSATGMSGRRRRERRRSGLQGTAAERTVVKVSTVGHAPSERLQLRVTGNPVSRPFDAAAKWND